MLKVQNIEIVYHDVVLAVRGISLEVPPKKMVALLGSNGAGKSTTLKAISNILEIEDGEIEEGSIEFEGQRIDHAGPEAVVRMGILQVPEGRGIFDDLTVLENLKMGCFTRSDSGAARSDLEAVFGYFPVLRDRQTQTAGYLSGGEQQMLAIGRALLARPKLLMMDEPSLGLAPLIIQEIFRIIRRIKEKERNGHSAGGAERPDRPLHFRYRLHHGEREDCPRRALREADAERGREGILPGIHRGGNEEELPRREALQAAEAVAVLRKRESIELQEIQSIASK